MYDCFLCDTGIYYYISLESEGIVYLSEDTKKKKSNEFFSRCSEQINKFEYIKRNTLNIEMKSRFQEAFDKMMGSSITCNQSKLRIYKFKSICSFIDLCVHCRDWRLQSKYR